MWSYSPEFLDAFPYTVTSPIVLVPYNPCLFLLIMSPLQYIPLMNPKDHPYLNKVDNASQYLRSETM
jgi:hypothetical protein